jgi:hypothetical protein
MARIRSIKPEFPHDEKLGECSRDARLLFVLLWTLCDDHGRFRASPIFLRTSLFPYDLDVTPQVAAGWLDELVAKRRVQLYEHNGESYGVVLNWVKHQRIDNAGKPMYPDPPQLSASLGESRRDSAGVDLDLDLENTPSSADADGLPDGFAEFWDYCPRKVGKKAAEKAWGKALKDGADPGVIVSAMKSHAKWWETDGTDTQFIPHPATWLNQGRWLDELEAQDEGPPEFRRDAVMERNQARARGEVCVKCGGTGYFEADDGMAHMCNHREAS